MPKGEHMEEEIIDNNFIFFSSTPVLLEDVPAS